MPFTGSEILEVAPGNPTIGCVVSNRWIVAIDAGRSSVAGTLPLTGTFAVMDSLSGQALVYTGLPSTIHGMPQSGGAICEYGGYAWFVTGSNIWRITPSTGAVTSFPLGGNTHGSGGICAMGGLIYMGRTGGSGLPQLRMFDPATGLVSDGTTVDSQTINGLVACAPDRIAGGISGSSDVHIWDAAGLRLFVSGPGSISGGNKPPGVSIGRKAYMPTLTSELRVFDVDAGIYIGVLAPGLGNPCTHTTVHDDGWIYQVFGDDVRGISPVTGQVDNATMPTSRGRRTAIFSANGQLWVPSGEPLT